MSIRQREKDLFHEAISIADVSQRRAFLTNACRGDQRLLRRMEKLVLAHETDRGLLSHNVPADQLAPDDPEQDLKCGSTVDRYRILDKLGEGGFGVVYMAEQLSPIQRRVALKIVKAGMDTKEVIARFESERQALALMDNPHIAKVLDAGATDTGRPYFAMELVRGVPITDYCDRYGLSTKERLNVFMQVCSAVQHAHQKGIIHRDIKPTNVLVATDGDRPVAKVIDFGIAKATQQRLTDKTLFTRFHQFLGSPAYMSPEQAQMSAVDVDTRSDIYSLGVLLYELLTGRTPLDARELQGAGIEELCRRVREDEAERPSQRLSALTNEEISTLAKTRRVDPTELHLEVRGDLDWIVMKAVEKDRTRRYATAEALALDVGRYLSGQAVTAAPPNAWYHLRKAVRRNRRLFLTVGCIAATLLVASIISTWLVIQLAAQIAENEQSVQEALAAKDTAEAAELTARQLAYASDMNGASQALRLNNLGLARFYVSRNRPTDGQTDLRNWEWRALWKQSRGDATASWRTPGDINWDLAISPDQKWLATGSEGCIRLWDFQAKRLRKTLVFSQERGRGRGIAFAPSGDRLYAASADGVVRSWSLPSLVELHQVIKFDDHVSDLRVSHDGSTLAVASEKGEVATFRLSPDSAPMRLSRIALSKGANHIAFSPDDRRIAIGYGEGIRIVDAQTLEDQRHIPAGNTDSLVFSPKGELLVSCRHYPVKTLRLHRADGELVRQIDDQGVVWDLAFSPDSRFLAVASIDHTIRLWNTESMTEWKVLRGHTNEVCSVEFTSDGQHLVSGGKGEICVFDFNEQRNVSWPISDEIVAGGWHRQYSEVSFSHDGKWLATRNSDFTASLRSPNTLQELVHLTELGENIHGVRFSPVEPLLALGDSHGYLSLLDPNRPDEVARVLLAERGRVLPVGFSADGTRLLVVVQRSELTDYIIWSVPDRRKSEIWSCSSSDECAAISPDGETVVTGHKDGTARIWSVSNPTKSENLSFDSPTYAIAFAPDGRRFAVGNTAVHLVDTATREVVSTMLGHSSAILSINFSSDGLRLAAGGGIAEEAVKIWDVSTKQELMTLLADGYSFRQVEFSPDDNSLMTIGGETLTMWNVPTLHEIDMSKAVID